MYPNKKHYLILLLISFLGLQVLTAVHAVEHAAEHHDHKCTLYLAGQNNDQACLSASLTYLELFRSYFFQETSAFGLKPAFRFNFHGRAPPHISPA
ncbi:MAG: hypothetical protein AB8D52_05050 [Gammaproteobacteria bacterium]